MKNPHEFDPKHDQNAKCIQEGCGHTYERHFDWSENNAPGCKYCPCCTFIGPGAQPPLGEVLFTGILEDCEVRIVRVVGDEYHTYTQGRHRGEGTWEGNTDTFSAMIYEMAFLEGLKKKG
jgi:hypothetical protein